ncbi:Detected protein of unknown function [Hibiscus syriacus]|uniref:ACB domain-containing protein n=1 Tax=Hibiscus syriacus TaxID=106335 RepID=A0A6A3CAZ3_HIBSY|nr:Detected protein of unknown function [Hibiscus syriacus]
MEPFLTAFIDLVFSFLIAKIVSLATGAGGSVSGVDGKPVTDADDAIIMQELELSDKLKAQEFTMKRNRSFEAGSKVEGFESGKEVDFMQETAKDVYDLEAEQAGVIELKLDEILVERKIEEIGEETEAENQTKVQPEESQMKVFGAAAKFIEHNGDLGMSNDFQMELYGLHKIATEGPCREPQPLAFMASSRSKWNAWQRLGNMNPEAAMEQYVTLLSDKVPGWMEDNSDGERNFRSADEGVPGSIAPDINSFPDKQATFTHERNADLKSTSGGGDITESTSFEMQVLGIYVRCKNIKNISLILDQASCRLLSSTETTQFILLAAIIVGEDVSLSCLQECEAEALNSTIKYQ